jgi:hypothetical protein
MANMLTITITLMANLLTIIITLTANMLTTRYDYNLTIMKSPKPATDTIYPHIKF